MLSAYFNVSLAFELCLQRLHIHVNLQKLVIFRSNMAKRKTKKVAGKMLMPMQLEIFLLLVAITMLLLEVTPLLLAVTQLLLATSLLLQIINLSESPGNYPTSVSIIHSSAGKFLASARDIPASANN